MKVIMLDIDGVLNNLRDIHENSLVINPFAQDHRNWHPVALTALDDIIKRTGAKVVISSSWRKLFPEITWWNEQFQTCGLNAECIGITGSSRNGFRGREVREWLSRHPEVTSYVILDDESDFYPDQPRIHVDMYGGLLEHHVEPAIALLEGGKFEAIYCMEEYNPPVEP